MVLAGTGRAGYLSLIGWRFRFKDTSGNDNLAVESDPGRTFDLLACAGFARSERARRRDRR